MAFLFLGGLRFWPGVLIGDLLANDYAALPLGAALGQTCGNLLEVVVAAGLLRRLVRDRSPVASIWGVGCMLVSIAAGTAVSATIGSLSLRLGGVISSHAIATVWRTWWLGDATGALDRRSAGDRVVPPAGARLANRTSARGRPSPRDGGRTERAGHERRPSADLRPLPGAPLGGAPVWTARRHARGRRLRRSHRLEHHQLRGAVLLPLDYTQRLDRAALHRCRRALDALPGCGRLRARVFRRGAEGISRQARGRGVHRTPAARAQPPRRRAAAPHCARLPAARSRQRVRAISEARRLAPCGSERSSSSRSTSCGSSPTGSIRPGSRRSAWRGRSRWSPLVRPFRSRWSRSRRDDSPAQPRRRPITSSSRRSPTRRNMRRRPACECGARSCATSSRWRSSTTESAARRRASARGSRASRPDRGDRRQVRGRQPAGTRNAHRRDDSGHRRRLTKTRQ